MKLRMSAVVAVLIATSLALPAYSADEPSDAWITTKVKMSLLTADDVDGLDIDVDTFDSRVTLHGQVETADEKARAARIAGSIEGVREVRDLIAVVPETQREATEVADDKLRNEISTVLQRDQALEESDIEIKSVNDGIVVLTGRAATLTAHQRALEDARSVEGVQRVASEIESPDELGDDELWDAEVDASAASATKSAVADTWITTKAKVLLIGEPGLSPTAINVDTRRGVVTLFGIVSTEQVKTRAADRVANINGVKRVANELQVVPDVAAERVEAVDDDVAQAVEKRLDQRKALEGSDIDVSVKKGVVRLTGTVDSQADRMTALTVARSTRSVDSVLDDLQIERDDD